MSLVPRVVEDRDDRDHHHQRPGERVEEELDRGVETALAAPDADQEVERDQADTSQKK
jgi:hypothetical protein